MSDQFKVVFTGTLANEHEPEDVIAAFAEKFRCSETKARALVMSGKETVIKSDLDKLQAEKYQAVLTAIGLETEVVALVVKPSISFELEGDEPDNETVDPASGETIKSCPKCGSVEMADDRCLSCKIIISKYLALQSGGLAPAASGVVDYSVSNASSSASSSSSDDQATADTGYSNPYQAPEADLTQAYEDDDLTGPVSVPAGHGWRWLADGFNHFKQNPVAWLVALLIWVVLSTVLSIIPVVGSILVTLLSPVITAGFMLGCQAQEEGDDFRIGHLFSGFSHNVGQLILVGLLYLVFIFVAMLLIIGGFFLVAGNSFESLGQDMSAMMLPVLIGTLLIIPIVMAYWFAPALVALNDMSAVAAMKLSFSACLKNMLPGLVFSLIAMVLFIVGAIPFGLGLLVVVPMIAASMYTAYRDIFYG
ncbi:BPSS1780 family membrane protein [Amphritea sp.]|uniref:BPSS1780 family membrane protein n=1 Tax=Amphritea sp. TaxID=1872502 RepID=UPI003A8EC8E0